MKRYIVSQFDGSTFVVIDQKEQREVCICGNYEEWADAKEKGREDCFIAKRKLSEGLIDGESCPREGEGITHPQPLPKWEGTFVVR